MEQVRTLTGPRTAGNENTGVLKLIAIALMIVDHVGAALLPQYRILRILGRIPMPLFCWGIVVGAEYSRNIWKYFLRIALVGVISQPFFMLALNHGIMDWNVFPTLALGLLGIAGIRWRRFGSHIWMPILAFIPTLFVNMDYGWTGVALILVLYACRKNRSALAAGYVAFCLFWGLYYGAYREILGVTAQMMQVSWIKNLKNITALLMYVEFWAILSLPLIVIPMKGRLRIPKWIGYGAYPAHLLVIGVIRHWSEIPAWFAKIPEYWETVTGWIKVFL